MKSQYPGFLGLAVWVVAVAGIGCSKGAGGPVPPPVADGLKPPAGETVFLEAWATGVQIYECGPKADMPEVYEWGFKAPEAALADSTGKEIGKHYAGPTWESTDGSTVVGSLVAKDPGPDPTAIPWLLLASKTNTGTGVFSAVKSVQRLLTEGGIAPTEACGARNAGIVARVPYKARYFFYKA